MSFIRTHIFSLFILVASPAFAQQPDERHLLQMEWVRAPELKAGGTLSTVVAWRSILSEEPMPDDLCVFDTWIDETGKVRKTAVLLGSETECASSRARLSAAEFVPVRRWWRAQWLRFAYPVSTISDDYAGPADRTFPDDIQLDDVVITMAIHGFGYEESGGRLYHVQIFGDGRVSYLGESSVKIKGRREDTVSRKEVQGILDLFAAADFFRQPIDYSACMSHLNTVYISLEIGSMKKTLLERGGDRVIETCGRGRNMPPIISRIKNEIDRVAGTSRWTGK